MKGIKIWIRLLATISLTTVTTNSVIACGNLPAVATLNAKVLQNLHLTNNKGEGLILPTISIDDHDKSKVTWKIDTAKILLTNLVHNDNTAIDVESFHFLKDILKIKIDSGSKLEDTIFNSAQLKAVTITVSNINVNLQPVKQKNDFYIANSYYHIVFTNGKITTNKYQIVIFAKESANSVIIGNKIFAIDKTDFNTFFQNKFKVNQPVTDFQVNANLIWMLDKSKDNVKTIFGIEKLINKGKLMLIVTKNDKKTGNFEPNDTIAVRFGYQDVKLLIATKLVVNS